MSTIERGSPQGHSLRPLIFGRVFWTQIGCVPSGRREHWFYELVDSGTLKKRTLDWIRHTANAVKKDATTVIVLIAHGTN